MANKKLDSIPQTSSVVGSFPQAPQRKAEDYLKSYSGYVYSATSAIAREVAGIDLQLYKTIFQKNEVSTEEIKIHEVLSLLQYVNPLMTFYDLVEATQVYLELVGEAFWVIVKDNEGVPRQLWPIRPDWVRIVPGKEKVIQEYVYSPGGLKQEEIRIPAEMVIPFKYFHPLNPYRGRGSVQSSAMAIDIHTFAQEWQRNFFFNNATPGLVFTTEKNFNKETVKRFVQQWQQNFGGRNNSHKIAFLGNGFKMDKVTSSAKDLDFENLQKMFRDDILAVFQVPKSILGLTEDVNRANAEATNRAYMDRVIVPRMKKFVGTLTEFLIPMYPNTEGFFFDFSDPSPEDTELKLKLYENARKFQWMTPNEIRIMENLEPLEGGDSLGTIGASDANPVDEEDEEPEDAEIPEVDEEEDDDKGFMGGLFSKAKEKKMTRRKVRRIQKPKKHMMPIPTKSVQRVKHERFKTDLAKDFAQLIGKMFDEERKQTGVKVKQISTHTKEEREKIWTDYVAKTQKQEVDLKRILIPLFERQQEIVIAQMNARVKFLPKTERKSKITDILFDLAEWANKFHVTLFPFIRDLMIDVGNDAYDSINLNKPFDPSSDEVLTYLQDTLASQVEGINETTREALANTLTEGFANEESIAELRDRVREVFEIATTSRANTIARTEVNNASNFAAQTAYKQSNGIVKAKQWISTLDSRVRDSHASADGQIVPVNKKFKVGGVDLEYPGDPSGTGSETINCRCTMAPITKLTEEDAFDEYERKAQEKAHNTIKDAVADATNIMKEAENEAKVNKEEAQKILDDAKKEADKVVKKAREKADSLLEDNKKPEGLKKVLNKVKEAWVEATK